MKPHRSRSRRRTRFPGPSGIGRAHTLHVALLVLALGGAVLAIGGCVHATPEQRKPAGSSSMSRDEASMFAAVAWAAQEPARRSYGPVTDTGSMLPAFDSRSILLLEKLEGQPLPGDILHVNQGPGRERIGHRVRAVRDGWVLLDGDNSKHQDGWFPIERVNWRVAGILYTNGR